MSDGRARVNREAEPKFVCRYCGETYNPPGATGDQFFCCGVKMEDRRPKKAAR